MLLRAPRVRLPPITPSRPITSSPSGHYTRRQLQTTSSINPQEVTHFNALAASWWEPHGPSRLLHQMNPLRHDFIQSCTSTAAQSPESKRKEYLDIGCGGGIFAESAARLKDTVKVTAIDPSSQVITIAKAHARKDPSLVGTGKLEYLNQSIEELYQVGSGGQQPQYDVVSLFEVIEHIDKPSEFLKNCFPFVKPGGWLVGSTIARTWTSWLTTKVVAEDIIRLVPQGTHSWEKYINPEELASFFARQEGWGGIRGLKTAGCIYVPIAGWRMVPGSEELGNYFFGIRKDPL